MIFLLFRALQQPKQRRREVNEKLYTEEQQICYPRGYNLGEQEDLFLEDPWLECEQCMLFWQETWAHCEGTLNSPPIPTCVSAASLFQFRNRCHRVF